MKLKDLEDSVVQDNGRRGNPLPGCDCEQCFGYCMIDGEERERALQSAREQRMRAKGEA